jgi:phytoene synthase
MKQLFDQIAQEVSKGMTEKYSTSFSWGIKAISPKIRPGIYAIYGFVRLADEIVDSFHDYDKERLLKRLDEQTWEAIKEGISLNPILQSFQHTVNKYQIDHELIRQFLHSMAMDLQPMAYNRERYEEYILGSAEVVGLMCLKIFVQGDEFLYEQLKPYAMKLGSAFQKVNFLRDLKYDYQALGRTYFPKLDLSVFDEGAKLAIQKEIEEEFKEALIGIKKLPMASRFGVYLAYKYYLSLLQKIKSTPVAGIMEGRVRIPNAKKLSLAMSSYVSYKASLY